MTLSCSNATKQGREIAPFIFYCNYTVCLKHLPLFLLTSSSRESHVQEMIYACWEAPTQTRSKPKCQGEIQLKASTKHRHQNETKFQPQAIIWSLYDPKSTKGLLLISSIQAEHTNKVSRERRDSAGDKHVCLITLRQKLKRAGKLCPNGTSGACAWTHLCCNISYSSDITLLIFLD